VSFCAFWVVLFTV